jgi:hypothetical protein
MKGMQRSLIPPSCKQFMEDTDKVDPFAGMRASDSSDLRISRAAGRESTAQVQRRMTNGSTRRFSK